MATKNKAAKKDPPPKKQSKAGPKKKQEQPVVDSTEPLSNFQLPKTGRVEESRSVITIEKVKIEKDDALKIVFTKFSGGHTSHHDDQFEQRMHPDLKNRFAAFRIHLALTCDYVSTQQVKDLDKYNPELVEKFNVTSLSIKEDGVVITGSKVTKSGKHVILNSPFTLFEADSTNAYRYAEELHDEVTSFQEEVMHYLDGSKVGEDPQGKLDFGETAEETPYADETA